MPCILHPLIHSSGELKLLQRVPVRQLQDVLLELSDVMSKGFAGDTALCVPFSELCRGCARPHLQLRLTQEGVKSLLPLFSLSLPHAALKTRPLSLDAQKLNSELIHASVRVLDDLVRQFFSFQRNLRYISFVAL